MPRPVCPNGARNRFNLKYQRTSNPEEETGTFAKWIPSRTRPSLNAVRLRFRQGAKDSKRRIERLSQGVEDVIVCREDRRNIRCREGRKGSAGIRETKAIAEEGLIYGLPLVMYYTSAYEFFVDKMSSQYKAPIGTLTNEARVFTYEDTAVITPNSDTPYSLMEVDLRAEPVVISVPAVPEATLLLGAIDRCEYFQLRIYGQPLYWDGSR